MFTRHLSISQIIIDQIYVEYGMYVGKGYMTGNLSHKTPNQCYVIIS